jgi:hypothetical protein
MSLQRLSLCAILVAGPALIAQSLPSGEAVMERYIEVTGGRAAYAKQHSLVLKGNMEMAPMGLKGSLTISKAEPNLSLAEIEFAGLGKITNGFNGQVAWGLSAMQGPQVKEGEEKASAAREAHFHSENWKEDYKEVLNQGLETLDGKSCYKLKMTPHQGKPHTEFYDAKSGLQVKSITTEASPMGEIQAETMLDDWRKVEGGSLFPHKIITKGMGQTTTITLENITVNAALPAERFNLPAEIKALVDKKK